MSGVLDNLQVILAGNRQNGIHITGESGKMDGYNRLGALGNRRFYPSGSILKVAGSMSTKTGSAPR